MQFTLSLSMLIPFLLGAVVRAIPTTGPAPLDVFTPPITFPTAGTVWASNTQQNVTWDASGAPASISNQAMLMLRKGGVTAPFILAKGFDLRAGTLAITVPYVLGDSDYQLVLFGDSGDFSPTFTIQSDTPAE
ncbi:hypothetical protein B0H11DRAFT_1799516 [Mycena galericulata]|nr:hypothetical protein B0H11DRAFT_2104238 [Mycena galericulata]KAJ7501719.1 hypothetical protein B0H11DRAFT_1799516 [Mycena galericulata]